jgi:2-methylcitrate dehydratase PrpD
VTVSMSGAKRSIFFLGERSERGCGKRHRGSTEVVADFLLDSGRCRSNLTRGSGYSIGRSASSERATTGWSLPHGLTGRCYPNVGRAVTTSGETTQQLAAFASEIDAAEVPQSVRTTQKAVIVDAIACAIATRAADVPIAELAAAASAAGLGEVGQIFASGRSAPALAAYVNGALIHALVFDAAGATGAHLGMIALAPVLAAAECLETPPSGADFLAASIAASEVHARLVRVARGPSRVGEAGWLDGQLLGAIGACAGAGRVLGLSPEEMDSAYGLAMMQSSGTRELIRGGEPPLKALYGGPANLAGVLAALLADSGVDARCDAVGGEFGLLSGWFGCENVSGVTEGLGEHWVGAEVHFKEWPATGIVQPYVQAARSLRAECGLDSAEISRVLLSAPREEVRWIEPLVERLAPPHAALATNSIPFALGCALVDGELWLESLSTAGLRRPEVRRVLDRLEVRLVETRREALLEVTLRSGETFAAAVFTDRTDNFGTLAEGDVVAKLRRCNSSSPRPLSEEALVRICSLVEELEQLSSCSELVQLLVG